MFKKFISKFLAVLVAILSVSVSVSASDPAQIIVSSVSVEKGTENADITISLKNNPGIASAKITIHFNDEILTLVQVVDAGVLGSTAHSPSLTSPYNLYWNNGSVSKNFVVDGTIATLKFAINQNAPAGTYPITVTYEEDNILDANIDNVYFDTINGEIAISESLPPEIDPTPEPVKEYSITASNVQIGNTISLDATLTTPYTYTGKIIFAAYDKDGRLVDAKIYNAAASIEDISISKGTATSAKLFWWNMDTLDAYCECVPVAIN